MCYSNDVNSPTMASSSSSMSTGDAVPPNDCQQQQQQLLYDPSKMEKLASWICDDCRCVTAKSVMLDLAVSRSAASLMLANVPSFVNGVGGSARDGEMMYEVHYTTMTREKGKIVVKLHRTTVSPFDNVYERIAGGNVYSIALAVGRTCGGGDGSAPTVRSGHEHALSTLRGMARPFDSSDAASKAMELAFDPDKRCDVVVPCFTRADVHTDSNHQRDATESPSDLIRRVDARTARKNLIALNNSAAACNSAPDSHSSPTTTTTTTTRATEVPQQKQQTITAESFFGISASSGSGAAKNGGKGSKAATARARVGVDARAKAKAARNPSAPTSIMASFAAATASASSSSAKPHQKRDREKGRVDNHNDIDHDDDEAKNPSAVIIHDGNSSNISPDAIEEKDGTEDEVPMASIKGRKKLSEDEDYNDDDPSSSSSTAAAAAADRKMKKGRKVTSSRDMAPPPSMTSTTTTTTTKRNKPVKTTSPKVEVDEKQPQGPPRGSADDFVGDEDEDDDFRKDESERKKRNAVEARKRVREEAAKEKIRPSSRRMLAPTSSALASAPGRKRAAGKGASTNLDDVIYGDSDDEEGRTASSRPLGAGEEVGGDDHGEDDNRKIERGAMDSFVCKAKPISISADGEGGAGAEGGSGGGKRRRKQLVEISTSDEKGYLITKTVSMWVNVSSDNDDSGGGGDGDDEGVRSSRGSGVRQLKEPSPRALEPKSKSGGSKRMPAPKGSRGMKQAGLKNFFSSKK